MATTLEQQLCDLVDKHDLSSLSITVFSDTNGRLPRFSVSVQGGGQCEFNGSSDDRICERIASALELLAKARREPVFVPALAPIAEAA